MCTKAKNPFGVLPLVTQKLDCSPCIESRELHRAKSVNNFSFWTSPTSKALFLHWNSYLTKCKCRPTDTRIFRRNRQKSNRFFFLTLFNLFGQLWNICWSKKSLTKKLTLFSKESKKSYWLWLKIWMKFIHKSLEFSDRCLLEKCLTFFHHPFCWLLRWLCDSQDRKRDEAGVAICRQLKYFFTKCQSIFLILQTFVILEVFLY